MLRVAASVSAALHPSRRRARIVAGVLGLVVVGALAFLLDLGRADYWDPGESRYVETVREMMVSGNWLDPTLGFHRYYDKPPGYFWLVGGAFALFGQHEWAARLPSVGAALLTIALVVRFAWPRLGPPTALAAGAILATSAQFVALGRSVRMDMLLALLTTGTLLQAFLLWERRDDPPTAIPPANWPLYVLPAAGLVVKGPVAALLPALVVIVFLLATRTPIRLRHLRLGASAWLAALLLVGWYVSQAIRAPDYLWTFLVQHNFGRFFGRTLAGHQEPFWYYLWILPVTFLPWTLFLPGALPHAWRRARRGRPLVLFLLAWCVVPFVFFSVSRAKLATYLLPIFPALALLVAAWLVAVVRAPITVAARALRTPALVWIGGMAALALAIPIGVAIAYPHYWRSALPALVLILFPVLGWQAHRQTRWRMLPALVVVAALVTQMIFYRVGAPVVNDFSSLREAAESARDLPETAAVFAYKTRGHSFTYYGGRTILRVRSPAAVATMLNRATPTAALVKARHLEKIRQHLTTPACIWWQSPSGRVLLANVARPSAPDGPCLDPTTAPSAPTESPVDPPHS